MITIQQADVDGDGKITVLDLADVAQYFGQLVPKLLNSVAQLIATRGDHQSPHQINLPPPLPTWSWGRHGTEDTKSLLPGSATVAAWLVVMPDASQLGGVGPVRYNVRRIAYWNHQPNGSWTKLYDGLPQWRVDTNPDTTTGYQDVTPAVEADGSYSFALPPGMALHMACGPWPAITSGDGIAVVVESRLLGDPAAVAAAKVGCAAGADYRGPGGDFSAGMSTPGYRASGFGQFRLLTGTWEASDMLSSLLTDDQVRANPPVF